MPAFRGAALAAALVSLLVGAQPGAAFLAQNAPESPQARPDSLATAPWAALAKAPPDTVSADAPRGSRHAAVPFGAGGWRSSDLVWVGVFAGGLLLVEPAERVELAIARSVWAEEAGNGFGALASVGEVAGHGAMAYGLAAGAFLVGTLGDEPLVARVGLRSLESLALATATTASLKFALGRERPLHSPYESDEFRPFELPLGRSSFPSGHTAHLFALAATVSRELSDEASWVPYVAYPVAGLVGASRVVGQKHWVTDVVSGAAVGVLASRVVGRLHSAPDGRLPSVAPLFAPLEDGAFAVGLTVRLP